MRHRLIIMFATALAAIAAGYGVAEATEDDSRVCVSAVGPVDQYGNGQTEPVQTGDCP